MVGPEDMVVGPARVEKAHHDGRARDGLLVGPLDSPRDRASLRGGRCRFRGGRLRAPRPRLLPGLDGADAEGGGAQACSEEEGRRKDQSLTRERADRARHLNLQETLDAGPNSTSVKEWKQAGTDGGRRGQEPAGQPGEVDEQGGIGDRVGPEVHRGSAPFRDRFAGKSHLFQVSRESRENEILIPGRLDTRMRGACATPNGGYIGIECRRKSKIREKSIFIALPSLLY